MPKEEQPKAAVQKRKPIRTFFRTFFSLRRWTSYEEVASNAKTALGLFKRLRSSNLEANRKETYAEAIARLRLSPEQIANREKVFLYSALIYGLFALVLFCYFLYLLSVNIFAASFDLMLVVLLSLTAYREHFWYMQMRKKKLGCNFHDWVNFVLRREA